MKKSVISDICERNPSSGPKPLNLMTNKTSMLKPLSFPSTSHNKNLGMQSQAKPKKPSFNTNNLSKKIITNTDIKKGFKTVFKRGRFYCFITGHKFIKK